VHLRVIAPFEERARNLVRKESLTEADAEREIRTVDAGRAKFVRKLCGRAVNDPLAYDITVNESGWPLEELVDVLTLAARRKIERLRAAAAAVAA
jgi:cytidylate kinase